MVSLSDSRNRGKASAGKIAMAMFLCLSMSGGNFAHADILRGGGGRGSSPAGRPSEGRPSNPGAETAAAARQRAQDRLSRTTQAIAAMRAVQASAQARSVANLRTAGSVPDGLRPGGLQLATGANARLSGANEPVAKGRNITIQQTEAQAVLHWETFNVGKRTTVNFDQSAGGVDSGKWIAFNKVFDPSGKPSQILGSIRADGQVYILNQNGIIFGPGSQVNARGLIASALPINDALIERGLLNQDAGNPQFLLSALPQGSFVPPTALTKSGQSGNVMVDVGARLTSPVSAEGSGGRIILAGANVENRGTLSTPSGQTILAAGRQVGFDAHPSSDPSLRGLDVYIGEVGAGAGGVRNSGIIDIPTGSLTMAGKTVEQFGVVDSATSVTLNGRIDLLANYNAVPNLDFNPNATGGASTFLPRESGTIIFGPESVTRIVPDLLSVATTVGSKLPIRSQMNLQGLSVFLTDGSVVQVPSGDVNIQAGTWRPVIFPNGIADGRGTRLPPDFAFDKGQVYLDPNALIDVSGTVDVFVPLSESILEVQLRGNELSIAPLQRDGAIRGENLVIDIRRTGTFNGRQWVGTPLGDASGFLNLIQRNAGQLTATGGTVTIQAGQSVIARENSTIDVSGGYFRNEGGRIQTSRLLSGGNLVDIEDATPDRVYDGFYSGRNTEVSTKWGVSETFRNPLELTGARMETEHLAGAAGGVLSITAPGMVLDGNFLGQTVAGPRQVRKTSTTSELPAGSTLRLAFQNQDPQLFATGLLYPDRSPTPPTILFGSDSLQLAADRFSPKAEEPIRGDRLSEIIFPSDFYARTGFGRIQISNADGDFRIPVGSEILIPERGGLSVTGRNISIEGSIRSPGGQLSFTAFNISPFEATILRSEQAVEMPEIDSTHGTISVGEQARLDVSGSISDDRRMASENAVRPLVTEGGQIRLTGYNVDLQTGSVLDVSGGIRVDSRRRYAFGNAGAILIEAGQDPNLRSILGGRLNLGAELRGFSGAIGGTLSIRAPRIQIGGTTPNPDTLALGPEFFNSGGFTQFNLTGIGAVPLPTKNKVVLVDPDAPESFVPAIYFVPGTVLEPQSVGFAFENNPNPQGYVGLRPAILANGTRTPVSLSFSAPGVTRDFVDVEGGFGRGDILVRGDIIMPEGAVIRTEPGASVTMNAQTVTIGGQVIVPGGAISITASNSFPLPSLLSGSVTFARPTVHLTNTAILSAAGETLLVPDNFGRRAGIVYDGGSIRIAGNILAESGAVLDVSGTRDAVDVHPSRLGGAPANAIPAQSGLNSLPYARQTVRTEVDSDGGIISLLGSQMLLSDATLLGAAGGPTALGGTLAISSGRFYVPGETQLGSDINLIVSQSDRTISFVKDKNVTFGIGRPVYDADGVVMKGIGMFAMDRFSQGGFDSLDLGFAGGGSGVSRGGNIEFTGPVSIAARGFVRLASGGIIKSDSTVSVSAPYVALGQEFRAPVNPGDEPFVPFTRVDAISSGQEFVVPETGSGRLQVTAGLIDVGTLVLKQIGTASLNASGGDIRGNGVLSIQGSLALEAAQIYPTTQSAFNIFAYDTPDKLGSVTITRSGPAHAPLAAGGSLGIYASNIYQGGNLIVPFGSITIGWDGKDLDPSTGALDAPVNSVSGTALPIPSASRVILARGSVTSVSGLDPTSGEELLIPYGVSKDALTLFDARGVDITASGLPQKRISIAGENVATRAGSSVDIRGGGDLLAYRFVPGNGGPTDLLGTATNTFRSSSAYSSGELVLSADGRTWAARVSLDPTDFATGVVPSPAIGQFWSQIADSYAIVPGFASIFAPRAPFNTGSAASALGGNPGFVSNLRIGDQVRLDASADFEAGVYTLLPRRYALLPGAFLVTEQSSDDITSFTVPEGASFVGGVRFNGLNRAQRSDQARTLFEVASSNVVLNRADYEIYSVSDFVTQAATRLDIQEIQQRPVDSGYLSLHGNSELVLRGDVRSRPVGGGRGSTIDISSFADITIGRSTVGADSGVVLNAARLNSFGAESLLIGGIRRNVGTGTQVEVRSKHVTVGAGGIALSGPDITIVASENLTLDSGARIAAQGFMTQASTPLIVVGDGVFARVSSDPNAAFVRSGSFAGTGALLSINDRARISGAGVILDSTYAFNLGEQALISAGNLSLGAGQISVAFDNETGDLIGQTFTPHLVLRGAVLEAIQSVENLRLTTYRSGIDFYGSGTLGGGNLASLVLETPQIRGFGQEAGGPTVRALQIDISNPRNLASGSAPAETSGVFSLSANQIVFREGIVMTQGYADVLLAARNGILFDGTGLFTSQKSLSVNTPLLAVTQGAKHGLRAESFLNVNRQGTVNELRSELGGGLLLQGSSVFVSSRVSIPSGSLEVRSVDGDITIAGDLDAGGSARRFYDAIRFTDGGEIRLVAEIGDVFLTPESSLSVSGGSGGGNAGSIVVSAENGQFEALGAFNGMTTGASSRGGSFELDTRELASFRILSDLLDSGGFTETRDLRIRTGDLNIDGMTKVRNFLVSADAGSIHVTGAIDAGGTTGGRIELIARDNLIVEAGSLLTVAADQFDSAGKGGEIRLEAGSAIQGVANLGAILDLKEGAVLDLSVAEYVPGAYTEVGSSAFYGAFQGTLHLRAPRDASNTDVLVNPIGSSILGASSILVEGYRIFDLTSTGGLITGWRTAQAALPAAGTVQRNVYDSANAFLNATNHVAMLARLLGADTQGLTPFIVLAPGAEVINRAGDLTLGFTNQQILAAAGSSATAVTGLGSAPVNSADWNLSDFRFGPQSAPGVLTLRASGNLVFNNALSDGFAPIVASSTNANSPLWLGQLRDMDGRLPLNTQSWSYRLTAGSDLGAAGYNQVLALQNLEPNSGSIFVGEFYPVIPNTSIAGANAAIGADGLTTNNLRIAVNIGGQLRERGTRYEVIRTGTGSINANAARDIQLRNQFATIYTAGVRIPMVQVQSIFSANDFRPPTFFFSSQPDDSAGLGVAQQFYGPLFRDEVNNQSRRTGQWSLAGGNVALRAGADIARYALVDNVIVYDSSRQVPNNWLYRRGFVDPTTGLFGSVASDSLNTLVDPIASTTWWVDFSNFFQGIGALGGGNVELVARNNILNVDAVAPTNARMPGRDSSGNAIGPDASKLLELGGGDVTVRAGNNIDGGIYYVERGLGILEAQGEIKTNATRSPAFGLLNTSSEALDSRTWLPTTLFLGKGGFTVSARQDVLLGPTLNTFLMPQGLQNKTWYRTFFSTYGEEAFVDVTSFGGDITHRLAATLPNSTSAQPIFQIWLDTQNKFNATSVSPSAPNGDSSGFFQPWIRLAERDLGTFATGATVAAPVLRSTSFGGDVNLVGNLNLFPSPVGTLEILSSGRFVGLQPTGIGRTPANEAVTAFVTARINVSDAPPSSINGVASPSGREIGLSYLSPVFDETGSFTGVNAGALVKQTLHDASILHRADAEPVRIYALDGDLEALTLYSPKQTRVLAQRDITNIAFYLQHSFDESISVVAAGRDIVPSNANAPTSVIANNRTLGNFIIDQPQTTVLLQGTSSVTTTALSGDIQLGGRGVLEVLAGRNLDLGTGPNLIDGRGVGITTIGRSRNPFLPFDGASLFVFAGVGGRNGGPAAGLVNSNLNLDPLLSDQTVETALGSTREHLALEAFTRLFDRLRDAADAFPESQSYAEAFALVDEVFGATARTGDIFTQARDIRTTSGGSIVIAAPAGGITMAPAIFGNPLTPPGIVSEFGGSVSIFTEGNLDIGQARIFTLRGGDITIWSTSGDIAAGSAAKTIVTAPPTRVLIDSNSAEVQTDLGGLATGGGIGVLASVVGVEPGAVNLIAPQGTVDAGDAGIRATGDINISAVRVLNADTIQAGGTTTGVPSAPPSAVPNVSGLSSGSNSSAAALSSATEFADLSRPTPTNVDEPPSLITVEVLGYGGSDEGI